MNTFINLKKLLVSFGMVCGLTTIVLGFNPWNMLIGSSESKDYALNIENRANYPVPHPLYEGYAIPPHEFKTLYLTESELQQLINIISDDSSTSLASAIASQSHPYYTMYTFTFRNIGTRAFFATTAEVTICLKPSCKDISAATPDKKPNTKGYIKMTFSPPEE